MRRLWIILTTAIATIVLSTGPALAEYPPTGGEGPEVAPEVIVRAPQGLAFTGTEAALGLIVTAAVLLALGVALVLLARRARSHV